MKKYLLGLLSVCVLLLLSGCGESLTAVVHFEDFVMEFSTDKAYKRNDLSVADRYLQTQWMYIEVEDQELEGTGYVNSMIIYKHDLGKTEIDLNSIIEANLDNIQKQNETFLLIDQDSIGFNCGEDAIDGGLVIFEMEQIDLLYFGQYFFIYNDYGYIMSFSSEEESDRDDFVDSLRTLNCD